MGRGRPAAGAQGRAMLSGLALPILALLALCGVALDLALGEARRWHPLVGFGRLADAIERRLNRGGAARRRLAGCLAWLLAVGPLTLLGALPALLLAPGWAGAAWHALLLYFCIGLRSLRDHALPIAQALEAGDLPAARGRTALIVSRDTGDADGADLARAGVESVLENGNDAV